MAFRRGYRRRGPKRRRTFRRKFRRGGNRVTKRYVHKAIDRNIERKFTVFTRSGDVGPSPGLPFDLLQTTTGTTDQQRIGDRIKLKSIRIRGNVQLPSAGADDFNLIRIYIVQWYRCAGSTLQDYTNQCFENDTPSPYEIYNHDRRLQYRFLYDKVFKLVSGENSRILFWKKTITRGFKRDIQYAAIASTPMGGGSNGIFLGMVSDSSVIPHPNMYCVTKVSYKDA